MGVVIKGNWLLQDPLVDGYTALEAYLPSQKIAISLAITFDEGAFDATTGSYANRAPQVFEQISTKLAPSDPPPAGANATPRHRTAEHCDDPFVPEGRSTPKANRC